MKALKIIGIILVSIILIVVVVGYIQPKVAQTERSIIVKAPLELVFEQANDLENRMKWSPLENSDSTITYKLGTISKGEGANYTWTSATQGSGTITYTEVIPNEKIVSKLDFGGQSKANGVLLFENAPDGIKVTWGFATDPISNPFGRLAMAILTPQMEMMFDQGLENLKNQAEDQAQNGSASTPIVALEVEPFTYISVMDSAYDEEMNAHYAEAYTTLEKFAAENNIEIVGQPLSITHRWDEETSFGVFEPAMPINKMVEGNEEVMVKESYSGNALRVTHKGSYDDVANAWTALMTKLNSEGYEANGLPWEVYVTGPSQEPDTTKWITEIYMPVK